MLNMNLLLFLSFILFRSTQYFPFLSIYRSHDFRLVCAVCTRHRRCRVPFNSMNETERKKHPKCKHRRSRSHRFDLLLHVQATNCTRSGSGMEQARNIRWLI